MVMEPEQNRLRHSLVGSDDFYDCINRVTFLRRRFFLLFFRVATVRCSAAHAEQQLSLLWQITMFHVA